VRRLLLVPFEQGYTGLAWLRQSTVESTFHLPLLAMFALLLAAVMLLAFLSAPVVAPSLLIILATVMLCAHFGHVSHWTLALSYRLPVLFVTAPFVLVMLVAASAHSTSPPRTTVVVATASGVMFVSVLFVQSLAWRHVLHDVRSAVSSGANCKTLQSVDRGRGTPITHWAVSYLAILDQGRRPTRFLTGSTAACRSFHRTGSLYLRPWEPGFAEPSGYYRLSRTRP
jgi:hypothetical protein